MVLAEWEWRMPRNLLHNEYVCRKNVQGAHSRSKKNQQIHQCEDRIYGTTNMFTVSLSEKNIRTCLVKSETTKSIHVVYIHPYNITRYTLLSEFPCNLHMWMDKCNYREQILEIRATIKNNRNIITILFL